MTTFKQESGKLEHMHTNVYDIQTFRYMLKSSTRETILKWINIKTFSDYYKVTKSCMIYRLCCTLNCLIHTQSSTKVLSLTTYPYLPELYLSKSSTSHIYKCMLNFVLVLIQLVNLSIYIELNSVIEHHQSGYVCLFRHYVIVQIYFWNLYFQCLIYLAGSIESLVYQLWPL